MSCESRTCSVNPKTSRKTSRDAHQKELLRLQERSFSNSKSPLWGCEYPCIHCEKLTASMCQNFSVRKATKPSCVKTTTSAASAPQETAPGSRVSQVRQQDATRVFQCGSIILVETSRPLFSMRTADRCDKSEEF